MPERIFLVDLNAYDPATETEVVCRFSTYGFDAGDGVYYEPRVIQPGTLSRSISTQQLGGRQAVSYGEITLAAIDGGIDYLADYFFDAREALIRVGRVGQTIDAFVPVLRAQIEAVSVERELVSIRLRDRAITLERPFSTAKYSGTNILPAGEGTGNELWHTALEGTPDDIKDTQKPFLGGRVALMEPVLVNTSELIYQVNLYRVDAILNVFNGGSYMTREADDYRSIEEMLDPNLDPAFGAYRCYRGPEGSYFKLGAPANAKVTASVVESWTRNSAAELIRRIIEYARYFNPTAKSPEDAWDWHEWDLLAIDEANASALGVVLQDGETTASLLDRVCESVGAFWGFDALGKLRVIRLDEPAETADLTLDVRQMSEADRTPEGQMPWWQVTINADRNYAPDDKAQLTPITPAARAEWLIRESRASEAKDDTIKATRLLAETVEVESMLCGVGAAQCEAKRRLNLFGQRRDVGTITLPDPAQYGDALDLGKTVNITVPRLGYSAGKNMLIIGLQVDWGRDQATITVWG